MLKLFDKSRSTKGQTAVEYVLMLAVIGVIIVSTMGKVKTYLVGNGNTCDKTDKALLCSIKRVMLGDPQGVAFRYFSVVKFQ